MVASPSNHTTVFISYDVEDVKHLDRLQTHLKPYVREGLQVWDNTQIQPGSLRRQEIEQALASAKVALLLVSADYLASDALVRKELTPLLSAAKQKGAT